MNQHTFALRERGKQKSICLSRIGIKRSDMRRLMLEVLEHRNTFKQEWERIHDKSD
jgi:hypothetical protein